MIVVDSSALLAIFFNEPERQAFEAVITGGDPCLISAINAHETASVLRARHGSAAVGPLNSPHQTHPQFPHCIGSAWYGVTPEEVQMDEQVDVTIPVEPAVARALASPARRQAAGRVLSGLLTGGHLPEVLAEAIADAKREARANGLTDEDIDAELDAWRAERQS